MRSQLAVVIAAFVLASGCAGKKVKTTPELSRLQGKKVALVDIDGEETARKVIEVALVNQLVKNGTFELISKQDIDAAKVAIDVNSADWKAVAKKVGADYALRANVLDFKAEEKTGYSEEAVDDSQLEAETGDGKTTRVYKVKRLDGHVAVDLSFTDVSPDGKGETREAVAEKSGEASADERQGAAYLPPRLRFLEQLANEAFHDFFEKYQ